MYTATYSPFGKALNSANSYHQIGVETGVAAASPHKLIAMLFDGYLEAVAQARGAMKNRDFEAKGRAICRAVTIVEEGLRAGLNMKNGGNLANDLSELYHYLIVHLTRANLRNSDSMLAECAALIEPLRSAWMTIAAQVDLPAT